MRIETLESMSDDQPPQLWVGVVGQGSVVRFVAIAQDEQRLHREISRYVAENAEVQLFSSDAARVREYVRRGNLRAAIDLYFTEAGRRWDSEWLAMRTAHVADRSAKIDAVT